MLNQETKKLISCLNALTSQEANFASAYSLLRSCYNTGGRVLILSDYSLRFKAMHFYEELVVRYKAAKTGPDRARVPAVWLNDLLSQPYDMRWIKPNDIVVAFISEEQSNAIEDLKKINSQQLVLVIDKRAEGELTADCMIKLESQSCASRSLLFSLALHLLCEPYEVDCPDRPLQFALKELESALTLVNCEDFEENFNKSCSLIKKCINAKGIIYLFGNGGSSCDALEFCQALRCKNRSDGVAVPAFHFLDPSLLTCAYNDGYSPFVRAVEAQVVAGDLAIGYSTSGNSKNVIDAVLLAKKQGAHSLALTGVKGELKDLTSTRVCIPADATARIQELHAFFAELILEKFDSNE